MELVFIHGKVSQINCRLANRLRTAGFIHLDSDMYFIDDCGNYKKNPDQVSVSHSWCLREAMKAIESGKSVVVSNMKMVPVQLQRFKSQCDHIEIMDVDVLGEALAERKIEKRIDDRKKQQWLKKLSINMKSLVRM